MRTLRQADSGRGATIGMVQQVGDRLYLYLSRPNWSKTQSKRHIYIKSFQHTIIKPPTKRQNPNDFLKLAGQAKSKKNMESL